jgi:hypothetical protein
MSSRSSSRVSAASSSEKKTSKSPAPESKRAPHQTSRRVVAKADKVLAEKITAREFSQHVTEIRKLNRNLRRLTKLVAKSKDKIKVERGDREVNVNCYSVINSEGKEVKVTEHELDYLQFLVEEKLNALPGKFSHRGGRTGVKPVAVYAPLAEWVSREDFGPALSTDSVMRAEYQTYLKATTKLDRDMAAKKMMDRYMKLMDDSKSKFSIDLEAGEITCRDLITSLFYLSGHVSKIQYAKENGSLKDYAMGPVNRITPAFASVFGKKTTDVNIRNEESERPVYEKAISSTSVIAELQKSTQGSKDYEIKGKKKKDGSMGKTRTVYGMKMGSKANEYMSVMLASVFVSLTTSKLSEKEATPYRQSKTEEDSEKLKELKELKSTVKVQTNMTKVVLDAIKASQTGKAVAASEEEEEEEDVKAVSGDL